MTEILRSCVGADTKSVITELGIVKKSKPEIKL